MKKIKFTPIIVGLSTLIISTSMVLSLSSCGKDTNSLSVHFKNKEEIQAYNASNYGKKMEGYNYVTGKPSDVNHPVTLATDNDMLKSLSKQLTVGILFNTLMTFPLTTIKYVALITENFTMSVGCEFSIFLNKDGLMFIKHLDFEFQAAYMGLELNLELKNKMDVPIYSASIIEDEPTIIFGGPKDGDTMYWDIESNIPDVLSKCLTDNTYINLINEDDVDSQCEFALLPDDLHNTILPQ